MIHDLTTQQTNLEEYMSDLSEEAYCAGWMDGLEYALWKAVIDGPMQYGYLFIGENEIKKLKKLSEQCSGWIYFDDKDEETFIELDEWKMMFAKKIPIYANRIN